MPVADCRQMDVADCWQMDVLLGQISLLSGWMSEGLQSSGLQYLQSMHREIQQDILENDAEIKLLSNKIIKNDYDRTLLQRLQQHAQYLHDQHAELQSIANNHRQLQAKILEQEANEKTIRKAITAQFMQASEQKRLAREEERRRALEEERRVQEVGRQSLERDYALKKREVEEYKRVAEEQTQLKMQAKEREKEQLQKEKAEYSQQFSPYSERTHNKDAILYEYCRSFMEEQKKMPISYKLKGGVQAHPSPSPALNESREYQSKYNSDQQLGKKAESEEKEVLRSYLQNQMSERARRKSYEKGEYLNEQIHTSRLLASSIQEEESEKARRREDQRRYDEELRKYDRMRSSSSGGIPTLSKSHNPITNPISFKIGVTNPYILREFEQAKERYLGDPHLKLRNLAMIGNTSLLKQ